MTKVLVGIDGSSLALNAAQHAVALLDKTDLHLTLLRVVRMPLPATVGSPDIVAVDPDFLEDTTNALKSEAANDLAQAMTELDIAAESVVVVGEPGGTICDTAKAGRFDLVVIGSHGSGFMRRVLLGSVSDHVVHHCVTPVLVVRKDPE